MPTAPEHGEVSVKPVRALDGPTPGLVEYLGHDGRQANWDGFRSHQAGAAYRELVFSLQEVQRGLCGYCEIDLTDWDRQVEHFIPQSDPVQGRALTLRTDNMLLCCKGGTQLSDDDARRKDPVKSNCSCGQAKQDRFEPDLVDPRTLPVSPALTRVRSDGEIRADEAACEIAGIEARRVERTIDILGLNVPRLRVARRKRWQALNESCREHIDDPQVMQRLAREELLPGKDGRLLRFFSTSRSYFNLIADEILAEAPRKWI